MIKIVDQLKLTQSLPLDAKFKINSLADIEDIVPAYIGHIFYSALEDKHYKVDSLKDGYFVYQSNTVVSNVPSGSEYVDFEIIPNYYIDTYEEFGAGGSTETPETIKTKYESNADTNAYTDAEKIKLVSVEAGAQVNPTFKTVGSQVITGSGNIPINQIVPFNLQSDLIATYAGLPTGLNNTSDVNKAYYVQSDKLVYVWDGTDFPPSGSGLDVKTDINFQSIAGHVSASDFTGTTGSVVEVQGDTVKLFQSSPQPVSWIVSEVFPSNRVSMKTNYISSTISNHVFLGLNAGGDGVYLVLEGAGRGVWRVSTSGTVTNIQNISGIPTVPTGTVLILEYGTSIIRVMKPNGDLIYNVNKSTFGIVKNVVGMLTTSGNYTSINVLFLNPTGFYSALQLVDGTNYITDKQVLIFNENGGSNVERASVGLITGSNNFRNKRISVLGDSISTSNGGGNAGLVDGQVWHNLVRDVLGCSVFVNAIGDSCIVSGGSSAVDFTNDTRIDSLSTNNPQVKIIFGGINDFLQDIPLGVLGDTDKTATFYGALDYLYKRCMQNDPMAQVYHMTPLHTTFSSGGGLIPEFNGTHYLTDYVQAIKEVAQRYGVSVIDTNSLSGITCYNIGTLSGDNIHPKVQGHRMIFDCVNNY